VSGLVSAAPRPVRLGAGGRRRGRAGGLRDRLEPGAPRARLGGWFRGRGALSSFAAPVDEFEKLFLADLSFADEGLNAALKALAVGGRNGLRRVDQDRDLGRHRILA